MQPTELWVKLNQFLVFVFPVLHVRWPQRLQHILRYWKQNSVSPNQKYFFLHEQQNDKMTDDWNPSLSSLEVWCQRKQLRYWCFQNKSSAPVTSLYLGVVQFYNSCLFIYLLYELGRGLPELAWYYDYQSDFGLAILSSWSGSDLSGDSPPWGDSENWIGGQKIIWEWETLNLTLRGTKINLSIFALE